MNRFPDTTDIDNYPIYKNNDEDHHLEETEREYYVGEWETTVELCGVAGPGIRYMSACF